MTFIPLIWGDFDEVNGIYRFEDGPYFDYPSIQVRIYGNHFYGNERKQIVWIQQRSGYFMITKPLETSRRELLNMTSKCTRAIAVDSVCACVCVCAGVGFIHKSGWFVVPNETCWALNITILASLLWLGYGVINIKSRRLKYYSCEEKRLSGGLGCRWIHWVWFHLMCCGLFLLNMLDKYGVCKITRQHLLVVSFESSFNQWIYVKWLMLFPLPNWWIIP